MANESKKGVSVFGVTISLGLIITGVMVYGIIKNLQTAKNVKLIRDKVDKIEESLTQKAA